MGKRRKIPAGLNLVVTDKPSSVRVGGPVDPDFLRVLVMIDRRFKPRESLFPAVYFGYPRRRKDRPTNRMQIPNLLTRALERS